MENNFETIDAYIASFPPDIQMLLDKVRQTIRQAAPKAMESISYGLAAYKIEGKPLAYFGGFKHHVGFYGTPDAHDAFKEELKDYKQGKGSIQFPFSKPLPLGLITRIVKYKAQSLKKSAKR